MNIFHSHFIIKGHTIPGVLPQIPGKNHAFSLKYRDVYPTGYPVKRAEHCSRSGDLMKQRHT